MQLCANRESMKITEAVTAQQKTEKGIILLLFIGKFPFEQKIYLKDKSLFSKNIYYIRSKPR